MFFAANNISIAEENSAAANSFKTKQHLSGSNFLRLLFGIKNILLFILVCFILFIPKANAKSCLSFLPYGFNDFYVHLPQKASFCIRQGKLLYKYKTDNYGGRLIYNDDFNDYLQVFGDSQVLGLDIQKIEEHYLYNIYKKNNFVIYAAPNNGPYEVINFLNKNKIILKKKIIVTFNFSNDIYRISNNFEVKNFVALKDHELDKILNYPFKYRLIVFKNLLLNKNFTLIRYDNKKMQSLFLNSNQKKIHNDLLNYFNELNETANKLDIEIEFIVTHPYWVYSINEKKNKLLLQRELSNKVEKLICDTFKKTDKINKILITKLPNTLSTNDLTFDKRHLKSNKINLKSHYEICN
tara:strand:+ start:462 stop:1520 length:1059 start_codon:yes stop_codon:yes gene_type:complete